MSSSRRRILFVAENVTLAQVVRLATLAGSLDPSRYDVHFACSSFPPVVFESTSFTRWPIHSLSPQAVDRAVQNGRRIYTKRVLRRYIDEEVALLDHLRPRLVVGDLRQSLTVSAPLAGVPYANLINAYWSPRAVRERFPLPDHPMVRLLGEEMAQRHFPKATPWVFDYFARPINELRQENGLGALGSLPEVLTAGDFTLYPDVPSLVPIDPLPAHHMYLGPVLWSPRVPWPRAWASTAGNGPKIYVTLGSSGRIDLLPTVIDGLRDLPLTVMLSTAGRAHTETMFNNFLTADYLPGDRAARESALVISNGGSTTGYQALAEGTPVIGIASNLDQYLAMQAIERYGAGVTLRAGSLSIEQIRAAVALVLSDPGYCRRARQLAQELSGYDSKARFAEFVGRATSSAQDPAQGTAPQGPRQVLDAAL